MTVGDNTSIDEVLAKARAAFEAKDLDKSIEYYTDVMTRPPLDEALTAECLETLAFLHRTRGDLQAAAGYLFRLVNLGEEVVGTNHPIVATWREELAAIYAEVGQYDQLAYATQTTDTPTIEDKRQEVLQTVLGEAINDEGAFDLFRTDLGEDTAEGEEPIDPYKIPEEDKPNKYMRPGRTTDPTLRDLNINPLTRQLAQARSRFNPADYLDNVIGMLVIVLSIFFASELLYSTCAPLFQKEITLNDTKPFSSPDQIKRFKYLSTKKAMLSVNLKEFEMSYQTYSNNLGDWILSLPSSLLRKEYWFQDFGPYLTDEQETIYIDEKSPESTVINSMKQVADSSQRYFEEKGNYPPSLSDLAGVQFQYLNPYTARTDIPLLQTKVMSESAERPAAVTIAKLIAKLKVGRRYTDEPALYPGCVNAYILTVRGNSGNESALVVHGCGLDGKPLSAGEGLGKTYVIAQIDGKAVDFSAEANPLKRTVFGLFANLQFRPPSLCIVKEPNSIGLPLYVLKYRGILGFSMLACLFLTLSVPISDRRVTKKFAICTALVYFGLGLLCIVNALFP